MGEVQKAHHVLGITLEIGTLVEERPSHEKGGASELSTVELEKTKRHDRVKEGKGNYSINRCVPYVKMLLLSPLLHRKSRVDLLRKFADRIT